jgi:2,3-dimethylmalate lyase
VAGLLGSGTEPGQGLRRLLDSREMVLAPGCYDALGARLVEEAGFPAAYMTGFGTAALWLGRPDIGLMTLSEMTSAAATTPRTWRLPRRDWQRWADARRETARPIEALRHARSPSAAILAGWTRERMLSFANACLR